MANEIVIVDPWKISKVERVSCLSFESLKNLPSPLECYMFLKKYPHMRSLQDFADEVCYGGFAKIHFDWRDSGIFGLTYRNIDVINAFDCLTLIIRSYDLENDYRTILISTLVGCWFQTITWNGCTGRKSFINEPIDFLPHNLI